MGILYHRSDPIQPHAVNHFELSVLSAIPFGYQSAVTATLSEIADKVPLSQGTVQNTISDLVQNGLAWWDIREQDLEKRQIIRTPKGDLTAGDVIWIEEGAGKKQFTITAPPRLWGDDILETQQASDMYSAVQLATDMAKTHFNSVLICGGDISRPTVWLQQNGRWFDCFKEGVRSLSYRSTYHPERSTFVARIAARVPCFLDSGVREYEKPDEEYLQYRLDHATSLIKAQGLEEVDQTFKDTLVFIINRVSSHPRLMLYCLQVYQLSQLGTGFDSSWENGGTQSDRQDDVILWFYSGGVGFRLRLRKDTLSLRGDNQDEKWNGPFPQISRTNRSYLAARLDRLVDSWFAGDDLFVAMKAD